MIPYKPGGRFRHAAVWLLAAIGLLFVSAPLVQDLPRGDLIEAMLLTLVMVTALMAVGGQLKYWIVALLLLAPALAGKWLNHLRPDLLPPAFFLVASILFFGFVVGRLLSFIVRAPRAKGTVTAIDLEAARAMPGVRAVMGPGDAPAATRLFKREVSYAGQPLAAVCAESLDAAERAARVIAASLVIEPAPHAVTVDDAIAPDAPLVRSKGNTTEPDIVQRGDVARGLADAEVTITREYRTQVATHLLAQFARSFG